MTHGYAGESHSAFASAVWLPADVDASVAPKVSSNMFQSRNEKQGYTHLLEDDDEEEEDNAPLNPPAQA